MKKIGFMMLAAVGISFSAFAADDLGMRHGGYGMAGCGLGSMVFESNSTMSQVLAATTNGTFGSQTFGISSGTSNCTKGGVAKIEKEAEMFAEANFDKLTSEMAAGKGETLSAFATVLGCESKDNNAFAQACKNNYSKTFASAKNSEELLNQVKSVVKADANLSQSCNL